MPPGIEQAYLFQIFNTFSWQIVQGLPVALFFKFMGASNTILGLANSLNPLLMMLQIPAAGYIGKFGYRRFALQGWSTRTFFVALLTLIPLLLFWLDRSTCMILTFGTLFIYSTLRGISTCAFLPWITHLVPTEVRGNYIFRDQLCIAASTLLTMLGLAALFYPHPNNFSFSIAFGLSFLSGLVSLFFLRRIPDVPIPPEPENDKKTPWRAMLLYPPFLKMMRYSLIMNTVHGVSVVFWMPVLRDDFHWADSKILTMAAVSIVTSLVIIQFFGKMLDRVGSRPLLYLASGVSLVHFTTWFLTISRIVPMNTPWYLLIGLTGGIGLPLFNLGNTRLAMATVPVMGRSHFFALYTVLNNIALGLFPILCGLFLDMLGGIHFSWLSFTFDHYSLLFFSLMITTLLAFPLLSLINEPRALSNEAFFRELLVETPGRAITRLFQGRWP